MVPDLVSVRPSPQYNAKDSVKFVPESENFASSSDLRPTAVATAAAVAQFTEHEVQRGDWLYDIGRRHNVDLRSLLKANPNLINPDSLHVGSRIRIPQVSNVCIRQPPSTNAAREAAPPAKHPSPPFSSQAENLTVSKIFMLLGSFLWKDRVHKVVDGDSLEWLAEKYGTSVNALRKLNNLQSDTIYTGSVLKIDRAHSRRLHGSYLGKKAGYRERNGLLDGIVETPQPVVGSQKQLHGATRTIKVRYGDTLADIACANGLTIRELQKLNHLRDDAIFEGDHLVVATDSESTDTGDIRSGRRRTTRPLFSRHTSSLQGRHNFPVGGPALTLKARVASGGIKLEGRWKTKKKGFQQPRDKRLQFNSPLTDGFISSPFGWRWGAFHEGVDLAAHKGSPILASNRGTVTFAGWSGGYGYLVAIQHEGGFVTRYAHCSSIHARVGQQVSRGQRVAAVGATGHATGPHLHFEVRRNANKRNKTVLTALIHLCCVYWLQSDLGSMTTVALVHHSSPRWNHCSQLFKSKTTKNTARVSFSVAAAAAGIDVDLPSSGGAKSLKADLLSIVAGLDRGILASDEEVEAADFASRKLEETGNPIDLPRDLDKLQGKWRLVYSSAFASGNLGGSRPGPPAVRFPLMLGPVYQRIDVLSREFDNIVEFRAPTPWPLPPLETRATLAHTFELPGGASVKIIFERTSIKTLGVLGELPPLDLPRFPEFLRQSSSGQFDVTYVDDDFRITRGDRGELRVFVKL